MTRGKSIGRGAWLLAAVAGVAALAPTPTSAAPLMLVSNLTTNQIDVFDPVGNAYLGTLGSLPAGFQPGQIAIGPDNNVFVAVAQESGSTTAPNSGVFKFTPSSPGTPTVGTWSNFISPGSIPSAGLPAMTGGAGIAFGGPSNDLFVTWSSNITGGNQSGAGGGVGGVRRYNAATGAYISSFFGLNSGSTTYAVPSQIAIKTFDPGDPNQQYLYLAETDIARLIRAPTNISAGGTNQAINSAPFNSTTQIDFPTGIEFGPDGNMYLSGTFGAGFTTGIKRFTPGDPLPANPTGTLTYLGNINAGGSFAGGIDQAIAFGFAAHDGMLYVADADLSGTYQLLRIDPLTNTLVGSPIAGTIYVGQNVPFDVQYWDPVPEPSTIAMIGLGFAGAVMVVRRRRRTT